MRGFGIYPGQSKKYMLLVKGELRNIEIYFRPEGAIQYRLLQQKEASALDPA